MGFHKDENLKTINILPLAKEDCFYDMKRYVAYVEVISSSSKSF